MHVIVHCKLLQIDYRQTKFFVCKLLDFCYNHRQMLAKTTAPQTNMTVDITHDFIWILNADKHLRFLQSKHLQCMNRKFKLALAHMLELVQQWHHSSSTDGICQIDTVILYKNEVLLLHKWLIIISYNIKSLF